MKGNPWASQLPYHCISLSAFVRLGLYGIAYPLKVMNLIYLQDLREASILVEAKEQYHGEEEGTGKIHLCVNLPHTALSRHFGPDLQTFVIHISCVGTTKLVLIYTIVRSMKNY